MRGHIRKRGKSWAIVIPLGRDAAGKKRQKWYTHPTRREAEAHLASILSQVQLGMCAPPSRLRLGDYLEDWLRDYAAGRVRDTTYRAYAFSIRKHIVPDLGAIPLARLTVPAIQGWLARMRHKEVVTRRTRRPLSPASVHKAYRVLREALRQAVAWGLIPRSPLLHVTPPRLPAREMRVWDEEQVRLFLAEAKRSSPHSALYLMAILTGMRQGELLALRWQDIDWIFGRASVRHTLVRINRQVILQEPKSAKSRRTIALPPAVIEALREHRERQAVARQVLEVPWDQGLVFCQPDGKPLHAHNLTMRDFRAVAKRAGLPRIRFHDLRHSHATLLLREGVHPKIVQERLGHAQISTTLDTYSHVLPGLQEDAGQQLAARISRD